MKTAKEYGRQLQNKKMEEDLKKMENYLKKNEMKDNLKKKWMTTSSIIFKINLNWL
jgi:homoserine trans-succinylase